VSMQVEKFFNNSRPPLSVTSVKCVTDKRLGGNLVQHLQKKL
jgi:hypothetical protein